MTFEETMGAVSRMIAATESLSAIGAELALLNSGAEVDPRLLSALKAVPAAANVPDVEQLAPEQRAMLQGVIRLVIRGADDLLNEPDRAPGWTTTDPVILESIGRASMAMPGAIVAGAPELANVTSFLDVGTGVGWLAVAATKTWPSATVVGIDVNDHVLERARANVTGMGLDDRITLRNQNVDALDDVDTFDLAWVPTFFMSETALEGGVARIFTALRPGGTILLARNEPAPDPVAQATTALRTIRGGGTDLDEKTALELLEGAGYVNVRSLERTSPMPFGFVVGDKPG